MLPSPPARRPQPWGIPGPAVTTAPTPAPARLARLAEPTAYERAKFKNQQSVNAGLNKIKFDAAVRLHRLYDLSAFLTRCTGHVPLALSVEIRMAEREYDRVKWIGIRSSSGPAE